MEKRILILSDINSAHTEKWVKGLLVNNFQIHLFSLSDSKTSWHNNLSNFQFSVQKTNTTRSFISKLKYFNAVPSIKQIIKDFQPDFVHAHYASSYGLLGALCNFPNFYVSVWGSDVYDFPRISIVTSRLLKYVFKKAIKIFSTGNVMAKEISKYTDKRIEIVSFGIDVEKFKPVETRVNKEVIQIGVIKSLEYTYGIDIIIKALSIVVQSYQNIQLRVVGGGSLEIVYKQLVEELNLSSYVVFIGKVPYDNIVEEYQRLDVFVNPSRFESFGVSIIEASSCGLPVIATNTGGQVELVKESETGVLIDPEDVEGLALAICHLVKNDGLRKRMGENGRKFVLENYTLKSSLEDMIKHYSKDFS